MKKLILIIAVFILGITKVNAQHLKKDGTPDMRYSENKTQTPSSGYTNPNTTHVDTYQKKDGTIVPEHNRTTQNNTTLDNWSTQGNTNPETGKKGTKKPK